MKMRSYNIVLVTFCIALIVFASAEALAFDLPEVVVTATKGSGKGVFSGIAEKTGVFAEGLRKLAYVISGFGIIMFTFLAICGKINFKHLGYIFISLFFLSGMGAFITYAKGGNKTLVYEFKDTYIQAGKSVGNLKVRHSSL